MLRAFVAVPLEPAAAEAIAARIAPLVRASAEEPLRSLVRLRWVPAGNLHLTVAFLGPTEERRVAAMGASLAPLAVRTPPHELVLGSVGAFPSPLRPRVLWLGDAAADGWFEPLVRGARAGLGRLGFALEDGRPIRVHLTLARVGEAGRRDGEARRALGGVLEQTGRAFAAAPVRSRADRLVLYESRQAPGGVRYHALGEWPLGG